MTPIQMMNRLGELEHRVAALEKRVANLDADQILTVHNLTRDELRKIADRVLRLEQKRA